MEPTTRYWIYSDLASGSQDPQKIPYSTTDSKGGGSLLYVYVVLFSLSAGLCLTKDVKPMVTGPDNAKIPDPDRDIRTNNEEVTRAEAACVYLSYDNNNSSD